MFVRIVSGVSKESKIDLTGVNAAQLETAKCLFETVSSVLGNSLRSHISPNANFFALGGNSLNAIYTISRLADLGYSIRTYATNSVAAVMHRYLHNFIVFK